MVDSKEIKAFFVWSSFPTSQSPPSPLENWGLCVCTWHVGYHSSSQMFTGTITQLSAVCKICFCFIQHSHFLLNESTGFCKHYDSHILWRHLTVFSGACLPVWVDSTTSFMRAYIPFQYFYWIWNPFVVGMMFSCSSSVSTPTLMQPHAHY